MKRKLVTAAAASAILLALSSCSGDDREQVAVDTHTHGEDTHIHAADGSVVTEGEAERILHAHASSLVPSGTTKQLVAFSDAIYEFTIVTEKEGEFSGPEGIDIGEVPRWLTVTVDTVLWSSSKVDAPRVGEQFTFRGEGWWINQYGDKSRMVMDGKDLQVGGTYLGAFSIGTFDGRPSVAISTHASLHTVKDGVVEVLGPPTLPVVVDRTVKDLQAELETVAASPEVAQFDGLSFEERRKMPETVLESIAR